MSTSQPPMTQKEASAKLAEKLAFVVDMQSCRPLKLEFFIHCFEVHFDLVHSGGQKALSDELLWMRQELDRNCAPTLHDVLPELRRVLLLRLVERRASTAWTPPAKFLLPRSAR